jgi:hypothetical protein
MSDIDDHRHVRIAGGVRPRLLSARALEVLAFELLDPRLGRPPSASIASSRRARAISSPARTSELVALLVGGLDHFAV